MSDFPFPEDCEGCGKPKTRPTVRLFDIPNCPEGSEDFDNTPCPEQGSFYSRLTRDFSLPAPGQVVKMYVCNGKLFTGCQWVGVCNVQDKTGKSAAFLRILSTAKNVLTVYNGCSSDNPIVDNPEVGTTFKSGTAIYPAPPRWCSSQFNTYISEAIANADGQVCSAILNCLNTSEEVCFSSVPAIIEEDGEVGLFGGIIEGGKKCLRWLGEHIFTGSVGTTLCFPDVPSYTDDPDTDGNPKHYVYFSPITKCLGQGAAVGAGCDDSLNFDPDTQKINKVWVCAQVGDNVKQKLVVPTEAGQEIYSYKDGEVFRWKLGGWTLLSPQTAQVIYGPAAPSLYTGGTLDLGATYAKATRFKILISALIESSIGDQIAVAFAVNNSYVLDKTHASAADTSYQDKIGVQAEIPADPANPQVLTIAATCGPSGGTRSLTAWITILEWK